MSKTYVTFGQVHRHEVNGVDFHKDVVAVIECDDSTEGRNRAVSYFGDKFFTTYFDDQFKPEMLEHFPGGLVEVPLFAETTMNIESIKPEFYYEQDYDCPWALDISYSDGGLNFWWQGHGYCTNDYKVEISAEKLILCGIKKKKILELMEGYSVPTSHSKGSEIWDKAISNGGKVISVIKEPWEKITCTKPTANDLARHEARKVTEGWSDGYIPPVSRTYKR